GLPVPCSWLMAGVLGVLMADVLTILRRQPPATQWPTKASAPLVFATIAICIAAMPLAQMVCFGNTDYRRPADAIVVFGAKAYADGTPSWALADRVRTGVELYQKGF